uniref:Centrosomal protein of 44 kDa n=1 Tax=Callorhinchus milii TaxID=7868 RepID=A0A4W3GR63_CALMI
MTTGDLKGCLRKLEQGLRSLNYRYDIDYKRLAKGDATAFLPIMNYAFTSYSTHLTEQLVANGVELAGKNDLRFIEAVYKVLRDQFQYKPVLSKDQFLHCGFAERKIQILCDIINIVTNRHKEMDGFNKIKLQPKKKTHFIKPKSEGLLPKVVPPEQNVTIKPLVERHLGNEALQTNLCSPEIEVTEDNSVNLNEFIKETTCKCEESNCHSEIEMLKCQIAECQEKLKVLDVVQSKLQTLERETEGKVIIDEKDWNNLMSRVILLETELMLRSKKSTYSSDFTVTNEECSSSSMANHNFTDGEKRVETPQSILYHSSGYTSLLSADESPKAMNINLLGLTESSKKEAMQHTVDRITAACMQFCAFTHNYK